MNRVHWSIFCFAALMTSVAATVVAMVVAPAQPVVIFPLAQVAAFCVGPGARILRMRRLLADGRFRTVPGSPETLARSGVRELTLRTGSVGGFACGFRAGSRGVIFIHDRVRPETAAFLVAHEAAHLVRYDQVRRPAAVMTALVCALCLTAIWPPAAVIGAAGVAATVFVFNRRMELDCDRLAVAWTGLAPAEQAFTLEEVALRHAPRSPLRVVRRFFTYPSPDRRRAAARRAVRGSAPEIR